MAMRRICMFALLSALSTGASSIPAFADPLQLGYSPYVMSAPLQQPVYVTQPQLQTTAPADVQPYAGQQYYVYPAPQQNYAAAPQSYAAPPRGYITAQPQTYPSSYAQSYPEAAPAYTGSVAPRYASAAAPPSYAPPAPATYAGAPSQPAPAPPAEPHRGFLEQIFGGPTIQAHVYAPAMPEYQQVPQPAAVNQQQAYAPSSQGDMSAYQIDPRYDRQTVDYHSDEAAGTIVIDTPNKFLYLVEGGGKALRYGIGVGRPGFTWAGVKTISAKKEWPDWRPPSDMLERRPDLPRYMPGGIDNPLGARAMYLGSTLYRIHGSNEPWTIGTNVSSGCIRMRNEDVTDLYNRVKIGTKVVVI
jgi:lipoprotein-anchoring transpeptidase ErfK/SrfK